MYISISCTANMLPNKMWNKSVELFATLIKITPSARNELNVIPIAVSLLMIEFPLINVMIIDANSPNTIAPIKKSIPKMNDRATPGRTACEIASPIRDIPLSTIKHPTAPATIPITMAVISAFCKKWKL